MTNSPSDFRWYTIQTLSNNEGKVKRTLERNIKEEEMGDFIAEILMPVKTVKDFRNGKKRESEMKLYPSYLFVRARLFDQEGVLLEGPWNFIKKTYNPTVFGGIIIFLRYIIKSFKWLYFVINIFKITYIYIS